MAGTFRIGRILGVPIGIHWSLLGIGLLLTLTMATGNMPLAHPGHDSWVVGDEPYVSLHFLGAEHYARH